MPTEDCICGQQTGRICPAHPHLPPEFRTISGPPLPAGTEVPWAAPDEEGAGDLDWEDQIAARAEDLASKNAPDAAEEAAAAAIVESMQGPGFREAADAVFAMDSEQLGRAAVEGARKTRGPGRGRGGPLDPRGCC